MILPIKKENFKKFQFAILFILFCGDVFSQSCISVRYKHQELGSSQTLLRSRLVSNDSVSFCYFFRDIIDPLKNKKIFSKKLIHHACYTDLINKKMYNHVNFKQSLIIVDTLRDMTLLKVPGVKKILGYECNALLNVNEKGDSILIWYSPELKHGLSMPGYGELPGIPLEVFDQRYNRRIFAVKVTFDDYTFVLPDVPIVTPEEFRKAQQN